MTELIRSHINNYSTTINNGGTVSSGDTTFTVTDASAITAELAVAGVDFVPLTIDDGVNIEVVWCTGTATNLLTVARGKDGTSAVGFADGVTVECRLTAQSIANSGEWRPVEVMILGSDTTNIDFDVTDYTGDQKVTFCGVTIATDSQDIQFQQETGGSTIQTTTYYHSGQYDAYNVSLTANHGTNASQMTLMVTASNSALNTIEGEFEMADPSNSGIRHVSKWMFRQQSKQSWGAGIRDNTEAVTGFRFKTASGDFKTGSKFIRSVRNH
jgi:hypothetical protein